MPRIMSIFIIMILMRCHRLEWLEVVFLFIFLLHVFAKVMELFTVFVYGAGAKTDEGNVLDLCDDP